MDAVTNGDFSEEPVKKSNAVEQPVENLESVSSDSFDEKNSEIELSGEVSKGSLTEPASENVISKEACSPSQENDVDMPEASELISKNCVESKCDETEASLTDSASENCIVDSLTMLNNSVEKIPSLFNEPASSESHGAASARVVSLFDSNEVDMPKNVDSEVPRSSDRSGKVEKSNEPKGHSNIMDLVKPSDKDHGEKSELSEKCKLVENLDPSSTCTTVAETTAGENVVCGELSSSSALNSCVVEVNKIKTTNHDSKALGNDAQNLSLKPGASSSVGDAAKDMDSLKEGGGSQNKENDADNLVFAELSNEETGFPEMFTGLVTIGKYISVKGDFTLRSSEALVESPSLASPFLLKEPDTFPVRDIPLKNDARGFFFSAAGELLIGIGLSRVSEWYHKDMVRIKKRLMKKDGKSPQLEDELRIHEEFYAETKKANRFYSFPLKTCKVCGFSTESSIVMEGHMLVPHINSGREFQCNFCETCNKDPRVILEHMFRAHAKTGRIQPPFAFFECPYCTFESNSKVKLSNHLVKCQRCYDPNRNLAPPKDFEFPTLTPKPITVAVVKAYEKSLSTMQRGRGRPKKNESFNEQISPFASANQVSSIGHSLIPNYRPNSGAILSDGLANLTNQVLPHMQMQNISLRPPPSHPGLNQFRSNLNSMHLPSPRMFHPNSSSSMLPLMGNNSLVTSSSQFPFNPSLVNSSKKLPAHSPNIINSLFNPGVRPVQNLQKGSNDLSIPSLPKLQGPYPVPQGKTSMQTSNTSMSGNSLVVCEICDGYIKDLEQLRSHMQLIHKVKIHPKMLVSRPPLNCQKCQWRFFTDQGLERHLLGSHGLVTSNMQELANKGKDAGCCTICGRVYASKLVSHMNQVHKLTLKPAHLSYKCTVCSATFNLYRLFENHVYLVHSGAAKRSSDSGSNSAKKLKSLAMDSSNMHLGNKGSYQSDASMLAESLARCKDCGKECLKMPGKGDKCEKCLSFDGQGFVKGIVS